MAGMILSIITFLPAVAALYGYGIFGEVLSPLDIVGMLLLGGALVLARGSRKYSPMSTDLDGDASPVESLEKEKS